jgi:hypothetical protein
VQAPWVEGDSHFESASPEGRNESSVLAKVWELNRYTAQAAVLDTYTDSNTRERRPYEADGLVASTSRGWVQVQAFPCVRGPSWLGFCLYVTAVLVQKVRMEMPLDRRMCCGRGTRTRT